MMDAHPYTTEQDIVLHDGEIIATGVLYEDYLSGRYGRHTEWIFGAVIQMSPVDIRHDDNVAFLRAVFDTCLQLTGGGRVVQDPFVMKPGADFPGRQPDLQVILPERLHLLRATQMAGAANLVVEVISPESGKRDRGAKFDEYERGGVEEYWLIDPLREQTAFYVRSADGLFRLRLPVDGVYTSTVLPRLSLQIALLWQEKLPSIGEAVRMVEAQLGVTR